MFKFITRLCQLSLSWVISQSLFVVSVGLIRPSLMLIVSRSGFMSYPCVDDLPCGLFIFFRYSYQVEPVGESTPVMVLCVLSMCG